MAAQEDRERVFYESMSASEAVSQWQLEGADVLVVDPPRKGLDRDVLDILLDKHKTASAKGEICPGWIGHVCCM